MWIPEVAQRGWAIITRDKRIDQRPAELEAVRTFGAKLFALTSTEKLDVWRQLEIVMCTWREIERAAGGNGPFIYRVTRSGLSRVRL